MTDLRIDQAATDDALRDWRTVHNLIIPTAPLSADEVRERATRNRLDVAYLAGIVVGCSTVRPPTDPTSTATVIARILPPHRRNGYGEQLYAHALAHARGLGAATIETIVLASNTDGLRFALHHGFVEVDRYLLDGDTDPFITLRLTEPHD